MDDKSRMKVKMWLIVIGVAIIGYIFAVSIRMNMVKQPQGEYMRLQDGMILAEALKEETEENYGENKDVKGNEEYIEWKQLLKEDGERILTFGQFGRWLETVFHGRCIGREARPTGNHKESAEGI